MSETTEISWCDATWNPWSGCTHVSPGCDNCYMFAGKERWGKDPKIVTRSADSTFNMPMSKKRIKPGALVFTCSWSDFMHRLADPWRGEAWKIIRERDDVLFLILTKRAERIKDCLPSDWGEQGYPNVVLGISAEDQERLEQRYWHLREIPARKHMISFEPMLGPIDIEDVDPEWWESKYPHLWGIIGGESGHNHRKVGVEHIEQLAAQLRSGGALVHVKQDCGFRPGTQGRISSAAWGLKDRPSLAVRST